MHYASSFANGTYHGYEISLRLERRNAECQPYRIQNAGDIARFMAPLARESAEHMYSLNIDGAGHVTSVYLVGKGDCIRTRADPKEVFKAALITNSPSFALVHNHPSGTPNLSAADRAVAKRIGSGADLLNLNFLDFVIIGSEERYYSMRDQGQLSALCTSPGG